MSDAPLELDRLLVEAAWLKRLALHLVGDSSEADDVVQETWVAALRGPRETFLGSPRAWLAGVARRVTLGRRRGDTRRRDRELTRSQHARPEGDGATDDVSARVELQRLVGEELERLPEPYRTALFLQYFEGLTPQQIAARSGEPAGTVRWRSKRGRELLREALVARDGRAWETWALALAPIAGVVPEVGASLTVTAVPAALAVMSKWISVSAVAGVLAALGLRVTLHTLGPSPAPTGARVEASPLHAHSRVADTGAEQNEAATGPMGARAAVDVLYTGPVLARGRLRSNGTVPLEECELSLVSEDGRAIDAFVTGSAWAAPDLAPGRWRIEASAKGHMAASIEVDVPATEVWTRDVELARTGVVPVRIEATDGDARWADIAYSNGLLSMLTVYACAEPIAARVPRGTETWPASPAGRWTLRDPWRSTMPHLDPRYQGELTLMAPPPLHVALVLGRNVVARGTVADGDTALVFHVDGALLSATTGSLEVTTVDELTGAPASCEGHLELLDGYGRAPILSRSEDSLVAGWVPAGDYRLSLSGQWAPIEARISVRPGERTALREVRLRPATQWADVRIDGLPAGVSAQRDATLEVRATLPGLVAPFESVWSEGWMRTADMFRLTPGPVGDVELRLRLPGNRRVVFPPQRIVPDQVLELSFTAGRLEEDNR